MDHCCFIVKYLGDEYIAIYIYMIYCGWRTSAYTGRKTAPIEHGSTREGERRQGQGEDSTPEYIDYFVSVANGNMHVPFLPVCLKVFSGRSGRCSVSQQVDPNFAPDLRRNSTVKDRLSQLCLHVVGNVTMAVKE